MNWYYADNGQQAGPIDDDQFEALIRSGKITPATLVWHEGLTTWQSLQTVRPSAGSPPIVPPTVDAPLGRDLSPLPGQFAGFWIRLVAKLIDGLVIGIIIGLPAGLAAFGIFAKSMSNGFRPDDPRFHVFLVGIQIGSLLVGVLYDGFCVAKWGATPGKMALQLKVISADGGPMTTGRAFGRAAAQILSRIICMIGFIIAAFDVEKRALHDHIAGTRVIYKQG